MANKKAEILTMDGQVVSPITLATNVLLDDGRTAQDLLDSRDESMFSPTITTSSSISKVGQGDDVDFSENVIDGAYKSCVLKGKTLVNYNAEGNDRYEYVCMPSVEGSGLTVNGTVEGKVKSAILTGQTLVNLCPQSEFSVIHTSRVQVERGYRYTQTQHHVATRIEIISSKNGRFKTNTTYYVQLTTKVNKARLCEVRFENGQTSTITLSANETKVIKAKVSSGQTLQRFFIYFRPSDGSDYVGDTFDILDLVVLEHQEGMENWDIPYFEGMQSVKMPVLTTTGKNLCPNIFIESNKGRIHEGNGGIYRDSSLKPSVYVSDYVNVKGMDYITYKRQWGLGADGSNGTQSYAFYDDNKKYISGAYNITTLTVPSNAHYFRITIDSEQDFQLEKGSQSTPYEPHKSNILTANENVELRGIGGVRDTLDCITGEKVERIGEIVLDGSENWSRFSENRFHLKIDNWKLASTITTNAKADKINVVPYSQYQSSSLPNISRYNSDNYGIFLYTGGSGWCDDDVTSLKTKLQSNPITVQYELATESIKTVVLSDNVVYSYKDTTHYTCSSEEGSLIPTLAIEEGVKYKAIIKPSTKYSVVFNRTEVASGLAVDLGGATVNVVSTTLGKNIVQITTLPTLSHNYVIFKGLGNVVKDVQVIEGDVVGDEPYFEGIVDVKNPSVMNCNTLDTEDENYKSNTISTNEIILRSLPNGVSDTLDLETGEYVQRIGEIVLDGSETIIEWQNTNVIDGIKAFSFRNCADNNTTNVNSLSDTYITYQSSGKLNMANGEGVSITSNHCYLKILTSKLETSDIDGLKKYLSQNPITVQYQLETPIITTIDLKQHPFAYKDGYVVLTSSSEEVSLTPTIEYSLIANRLGQIQSNQKLVEKQQAQIDELESMVIANLVNTQYQQALNEIKLGVK